MREPDHMEVGQEVVLDNGERLCILGLQFLPVPTITIGSGTELVPHAPSQARWCVEAVCDTVVVWLPEYRAWRIGGAKLQPVFNEATVGRQAGC